MRKTTILFLAVTTLFAFAACAEMMNALEKNSDENTQTGKLIRGANRLRKSFQDLDPSEEHYVGRAVAAQILSIPGTRLNNDPALNDYVNRVGQGLSISTDKVRQTFNGYRFAIIDSSELNALATPGGTIFVTSELVKTAEIEDELAGVLAHEIAHVTLRHGLAAIKQSNLAEAFQYLGDSAATATLTEEQRRKVTNVFGSSIDDVVTTMVKNGYSREAEYAADRLGYEILSSSGYDSGALHSIINKLKKKSAGGRGGIMSTHPAPEDRLQNLGPWPPAPADENDIRTRLARFQNVVLR